jgi:hypothetical protein
MRYFSAYFYIYYIIFKIISWFMGFNRFLHYQKLNPGGCRKYAPFFAKLAIENYKEIGHYFGHSPVGRTPLGGRRD